MTDAATPLPTRLEHFPISFFGGTMGLVGLALALLVATIAYLVARTLRAMSRREICQPE